MRRGYIRISKAGPSREQQEDALRSVGLDDFSRDGPIYVDLPRKGALKAGQDPLPRRSEALRGLREGDELVVMSVGRLGLTTEDTMHALARLGAQGATLFEVESGRAYSWHPEAAEIAELAARSETQRRKERLAKMRAAANEMGVRRGSATKLSRTQLAEAKADWASVALTAEEVSAKHGVPVRTLYRMFKARGTPLFGNKERKGR
jgi:hypothetical protein